MKNDTASKGLASKVFIVTPSYNSEETIEQTLMSVYLQHSELDIEYHIQDGGSSDGTLDLLKKWAEKFKANRKHISFSYTSEKDMGMYDAIVKGFRTFTITDNDWMCWINSDDQLSGIFTNTLAKVSSNYPEIEWVTGRTAVFDKKKQLHIHERYYDNSFIMNGLCNGKYWFFIQQEGSCWKSKLWNKIESEALLSHYKLAGDFALWVNFAKHAQIHLVQHPMGFFNMRDGQLSASQFDNYIKETLLCTQLNEASKDDIAKNIKNFQSHNLYLKNEQLELKIEKITVGVNKKVTIVDEYVTQ